MAPAKLRAAAAVAVFAVIAALAIGLLRGGGPASVSEIQSYYDNLGSWLDLTRFVERPAVDETVQLCGARGAVFLAVV